MHSRATGGGKALPAVRVDAVEHNNHEHAFHLLLADGREVEVPYEWAKVGGRVLESFPDDDTGRHSFAFRVAGQADLDGMLVDEVLYRIGDPEVLHQHLLYKLTREANARFKESGLSKRQLARVMGTSPSRLANLLEPAREGKSIKAMSVLLMALGAEVDVTVRDRERET